MLVIISDLHLTDGTCCASLGPGAFHIFSERLRDMAARASWRADGGYRPIERIDLVLLGDVLDMIRSDGWLQLETRPWDAVDSPQMVESVSAIADNILEHNRESLNVLRSLASEGAVCIPPANQACQPVYNGEGFRVPVRTHYMVGNHDWFLHLQGSSYDMLRQKVSHHLGLANPHTTPFPHDPQESGELMEAMGRHRVFARHGDIFDPLNFCEDRDASSLGDAIAIELASRFVLEVEHELGDDIEPALLAALREIDHIRPLLLIPVWLDGQLDRCCSKPSIRKRVKSIWDRLADEFLALDMVRDRDSWSSFDLVDGLEAALKFSKRMSIGWSGKITSWLNNLRGSKINSYSHHALSEKEFRNRRARHVVYGHTHQAEDLPLDASSADGFVLNQMYFNSGTWRRVHRATQSTPGEHEFIASETMTYLSFYQGDERGGRPYESWTGSLGVNPQEAAARMGVQGETHFPSQPAAPASLPIRPPHFNPAAAQTRSAMRRV